MVVVSDIVTSRNRRGWMQCTSRCLAPGSSLAREKIGPEESTLSRQAPFHLPTQGVVSCLTGARQPSSVPVGVSLPPPAEVSDPEPITPLQLRSRHSSAVPGVWGGTSRPQRGALLWSASHERCTQLPQAANQRSLRVPLVVPGVSCDRLLTSGGSNRRSPHGRGNDLRTIAAAPLYLLVTSKRIHLVISTGFIVIHRRPACVLLVLVSRVASPKDPGLLK